MAKKTKLPADTSKRAKSIVDIAAKESSKEEVKSAGQQLGRLGGLKGGGKARAKSLSAKQRSEIAKKAAAARWHNKE
jgi:hypothetical protein